MRNKGVKRMEAFNKKVEKIVLEAGGELSDFYQWKLKTLVGDWFVTVHKPAESALFTIFTSFDEPERMMQQFPNIAINKHSGKCNFHFTDEKECLDLFKFTLNTVKP